jgi:hypothetical protein
VSENPIANISPDFLDKYFAMDPLQMSDQDMLVIVDELRRMRASWESDVKPTTRTKKLTTPIDLKAIGL